MTIRIQNRACRGRLAGEYVDACRRDVWEVARQTPRPIATVDLERSLHASISNLLHRERNRLISHDDSDARYVPEWVHEELGELKRLLDLPELTSILEGRVRVWRAGVIELLRRIKQDWPAIVESFGVDSTAGLSAISQPLGDLHNSGRSVYSLTFEDGVRVIYKPRSVAGEHTLDRVIAWLNANRAQPELRSFKVLPRAGYGWTEFVPKELCTSVSQATMFFMRQGAFLALFYLLCAQDCIEDNLIVARDYPIWVDAECVCTPGLITDEQSTVSSLPSWLRDSVTATGLIGVPGSVVRSGLSVSCLPDRSLVFVRENVLEQLYIDAVERGFERVYRFLLERRRAWAGSDGPLAWWRGQPTRVVLRSTALYARLSDAFLVVPVHRREELRRRVVAFFMDVGAPLPNCERLVEAEIAALVRGDVPYWSTATDSRVMHEAAGATVEGLVARSGIERVFDRAAEMSIASLERQLWLLDACLHLRSSAPL